MAATTSRSSLAAVRRLTLSRRPFHASSVQQGGMSPPLPAFKRNPARFEKLTENSDALWDDGVAPELALDFDSPNVSTREAFYTWLGGLGAFAGLYGVCSMASSGDDNPAYAHAKDVVVPDYADHQAVPVSK